MYLSTILNNLSYGELSQQSIGTSNAGMIADEDVPAIVSHIQLGLTNIYTRFLVKRRQLTVKTFPQINIYKLKSAFAITNTSSSEPIQYLLDSSDNKFTDDLIRVEQAVNPLGIILPLNDVNMSNSAFTPVYNQFQFPTNYVDEYAILVYRANHPVLLSTTMAEADLEELELPEMFQEAILAYVHGRILQGQGGQEKIAESMNYFQRYESFMRQIKFTNAISNDIPTNHKMEARGWL